MISIEGGCCGPSTGPKMPVGLITQSSGAPSVAAT